MSDEQLLNRVWTYTLERLGQVSQDSNSGRRGCIFDSAVDAKGEEAFHRGIVPTFTTTTHAADDAWLPA